MKYTHPLKYPSLLVLTGIVCFFPLLGSVHLFDWDEINFAESAREMLVTGEYLRVQIDFEPFTEKPPLFFWMQTLSMKLFGVGSFAARFPNALFGLFVLLTLYVTGRRLMDERFGFLWALFFLGSFLPHLYFRSGIIDPSFNFFMFLGVGFLARTVYLYKLRHSTTHAALAGIATGLAVLTKGPVGFLLVALTFLGYWAYRRFTQLTGFRQVFVFALACFVTTLAWYGVETVRNGPTFLHAFIIRQVELFTTPDAGHGQPFYYHFIVLLIGCFPASIFAIKSLYSKGPYPGSELAHFRYWMISLLVVVLIVFSLSTTKIVHYSSMAYYPLTFLAAYHVYNLSRNRWIWNRWWSLPLLLIGVLIGAALAALPLIDRIKPTLLPMIQDPFAVANLQAEVVWTGWESLIGLGFITGLTGCMLLLHKGRYLFGSYVLAGTVALTMLLATTQLVPRIEQYTQKANIDFFKSLKGQDVYCGTLWYKSYAPLFYAQRMPGGHTQRRSQDWLLLGEIDKPVYFSVKIQDRHRMKEYPHFDEIGEKNGFIFFKREPDLSNKKTSGQ